MCKEVISVKEIGIDRVGDALCLFGELECEYPNKSCLKIMFEGFPCHSMENVLNLITDENMNQCGKIDIPGLKIFSNKMNFVCFNQTVRKLFGLAIGSVPKEFVDITLNFKEEWE